MGLRVAQALGGKNAGIDAALCEHPYHGLRPLLTQLRIVAFLAVGSVCPNTFTVTCFPCE